MIARVLVLVAALVGGCAEPLPVHVLDHDDIPLEVEDACEIIGLLCESDDHDYGTITIELVPLTPSGTLRVRGVTEGGGSCSPEIWVEPVPRLIAHELAHALGLEHRESEDGLMRAVRQGDELSDDEQDEIERGGNRLVGCRL